MRERRLARRAAEAVGSRPAYETLDRIGLAVLVAVDLIVGLLVLAGAPVGGVWAGTWLVISGVMIAWRAVLRR